METRYIGDTPKGHNGKSSEPPYQTAVLTEPLEDLEEKTLEFFDKSPNWVP